MQSEPPAAVRPPSSPHLKEEVHSVHKSTIGVRPIVFRVHAASAIRKVKMGYATPRHSTCLVENDKFNTKKFHHHPLVTITTSLTSRTSHIF